jgi:hypothetical protein
MSGISVAVVPKFSLSRFWKDCIDSEATIFLYGELRISSPSFATLVLTKWVVGELVRYLLSAPPSENDKKHKIRLIWGNGLSPELWDRFQVPHLV